MYMSHGHLYMGKSFITKKHIYKNSDRFNGFVSKKGRKKEVKL